MSVPPQHLGPEAGAFRLTGGNAILRSLRPPPPEYPIHSVVGRFIVTWAHWEHAFDMAIWAGADFSDAEGFAVTKKLLGPAARLELLLEKLEAPSFPTTLNDETQRQLDLTKGPDGLAMRRNRVAHNPLFGVIGGELLMELPSLRKATSRRMVGVETSELERLAEDLRLAQKAASSLRSHIMEWLQEE